MSFELGRALYLSDAVGQDALAKALLFAATHGIALPRALLATGAIDPERLEAELARGDAPLLRHVVPLPLLVHQLPAGLCDRLLAVPSGATPAPARWTSRWSTRATGTLRKRSRTG